MCLKMRRKSVQYRDTSNLVGLYKKIIRFHTDYVYVIKKKITHSFMKLQRFWKVYLRNRAKTKYIITKHTSSKPFSQICIIIIFKTSPFHRRKLYLDKNRQWKKKKRIENIHFLIRFGIILKFAFMNMPMERLIFLFSLIISHKFINFHYSI